MLPCLSDNSLISVNCLPDLLPDRFFVGVLLAFGELFSVIRLNCILLLMSLTAKLGVDSPGKTVTVTESSKVCF